MSHGTSRTTVSLHGHMVATSKQNTKPFRGHLPCKFRMEMRVGGAAMTAPTSYPPGPGRKPLQDKPPLSVVWGWLMDTKSVFSLTRQTERQLTDHCFPKDSLPTPLMEKPSREKSIPQPLNLPSVRAGGCQAENLTGLPSHSKQGPGGRKERAAL